MIALQYKPLDIAAIEQTVHSPKCGAVLVFVGRTRDNFEQKKVLSLEYEAYEAMAIKELEAIADELQREYLGTRISMVHRLGSVPIAEASVVIAVATPHRDQCYQVSRKAIEALKSRVPIWKKEVYQEGEAWKANQFKSQIPD